MKRTKPAPLRIARRDIRNPVFLELLDESAATGADLIVTSRGEPICIVHTLSSSEIAKLDETIPQIGMWNFKFRFGAFWEEALADQDGLTVLTRTGEPIATLRVIPDLSGLIPT